MQLVFDIETVANDRLSEYIDTFPPKPKANLVDPIKIAADLSEKRAEMKDKAGLHWTTGRVVAISVGAQGSVQSWYGDEADVLTGFFNHLYAIPTVGLIGKFSRFFDEPFLVGRALVHNLGIPLQLRKLSQLSDIDDIFGGKWSDQSASLDKYAWALSLDAKLGHGSDVQKWFDAGDLETIKKYCEHDVRLTCEILARYKKEYHPGGLHA